MIQADTPDSAGIAIENSNYELTNETGSLSPRTTAEVLAGEPLTEVRRGAVTSVG